MIYAKLVNLPETFEFFPRNLRVATCDSQDASLLVLARQIEISADFRILDWTAWLIMVHLSFWSLGRESLVESL